MIGADELLTVLTDTLKHSKADQTEISVEAITQGITRYATSQIHQTTALDEINVRVRAVVGKSVGQAAGSTLQPQELRTLVDQATSVARLQESNPQFVSLPEAESIVPVRGFDGPTAHLGAEERAEAIGAVVERVRDRGWTAAGTYLTEGRELAVVSSLGVSAYAPSSRAYLRTLPDSGKGTGYAAAWSYRAADLDPGDVAETALERCARNHDQLDIEPGEYETIFGELCVAEALLYLARHGFSGQAFEEGTSFLSDRLGQKVTGSNVSIWDDATDPRGLAVACDYEGVPKRKVSLIEDGRAVQVVHDSYTAHRIGTRSTGHASDPERSSYGPVPANLFMAGGTATLQDMIAATKRGLLLTRFHYTHCPDPKRVVMTGTTRDGTLLIENGKIAGAVKNLRLTQSVPDLFEGIELLGAPLLCQDWWCSNGMGRLCYVCPPIKVRRAVFTSSTLF